MILQIDEQWRISSDRYCWMVQKKGQQKNKAGEREVRWLAESYHPTVEQALESAAERFLRLSPAEGMGEALAAVHGALARLSGPLRELREAARRARVA